MGTTAPRRTSPIQKLKLSKPRVKNGFLLDLPGPKLFLRRLDDSEEDGEEE